MTRSFLFAATFLLLGTTHPAFAADGKALFQTTCVACHGAKAQGAIPGVPNLAKRLGQADAVLVAHILNGFQTKGSPMAMPPKGGNPNLTAADAKAIVTYLRTLTGKSALPAANAAPKRAPVAATAIAAAPRPAPAPLPVVATAVIPALAPVAEAAMVAAPAKVVATSQRAVAPVLQPDMAAFAHGAKAWADNCNRCHNMRDPGELRDDQWRVAVTHMRLRAGLTGQEARDILTFLQGSNNSAAVK